MKSVFFCGAMTLLCCGLLLGEVSTGLRVKGGQFTKKAMFLEELASTTSMLFIGKQVLRVIESTSRIDPICKVSKPFANTRYH